MATGKMFGVFFVTGKSQDGNSDCDFNLGERSMLSTAPQKKTGGLQLKDDYG